MNLDNSPLQIRQQIFFEYLTTTGAKKYKAGEVIDLNEAVNCVKLRFHSSKTRLKSDWFPLVKLARAIPEPEVVK